jgi:hypothetical protein
MLVLAGGEGGSWEAREQWIGREGCEELEGLMGDVPERAAHKGHHHEHVGVYIYINIYIDTYLNSYIPK